MRQQFPSRDANFVFAQHWHHQGAPRSEILAAAHTQKTADSEAVAKYLDILQRDARRPVTEGFTQRMKALAAYFFSQPQADRRASEDLLRSSVAIFNGEWGPKIFRHVPSDGVAYRLVILGVPVKKVLVAAQNRCANPALVEKHLNKLVDDAGKLLVVPLLPQEDWGYCVQALSTYFSLLPSNIPRYRELSRVADWLHSDKGKEEAGKRSIGA